ncbi:UTP-glucose-1-phosphate uridylyltransferase [Rhizoctonia solani]|uniref:UTP--glucose-1-phosphate uridylyltransferase n=1 Tax=Rhizoctonia solani TaxID=456999 RepID=A0A8H7IE23_9AGAM|nr:UTP-glucose-1-phosphate uridylyltransferase [Rhizoctonia solani]
MSSYLSAPSNDGVKSTRQRGHSAMNFKTASTGVAAAAMRNELNRMIADVKDSSQRKIFEAEMHSFFDLFNRYLDVKAKGTKIDWDKIKPPPADRVIDYKSLPEQTECKEYLDKLVVLKLNGGLGTTMGLAGTPKSAIEVREGMTFLDLSVRQIEHLNEKYKVNVPLILMNSFNTDDETQRIIQKYANHNIQILTFNQSRFPRVGRESNLPVPRSATSDKSQWYPPGHGDIFDALKNSGLLDKLIAAGKEYIFVSNADNLGADVDLRILKVFAEGRKEGPIDYLMELTDKTRADVKGGTIIDYDGHIRLLEVAQVPSEHVEDFKSVTKFKIFNTNNLWMNLQAIKNWMSQGNLGDEDDGLDIIVNPRSLMTASLLSSSRPPLVLPSGTSLELVIANFQKRFRTIPNILELDHLTVAGDVWFGRKVTLRGTVIILPTRAQDNLPDGSILENKLVSGNVSIIDH